MKKNYFIVLILLFTVFISATACKQSTSKRNRKDTNSYHSEFKTTKFSTSTPYYPEEYELKNTLFQKGKENCTNICYWLNGKTVNIETREDIEQFLNILSSVKLYETENITHVDGGIFIDIIYGTDKISVALL